MSSIPLFPSICSRAARFDAKYALSFNYDHALFSEDGISILSMGEVMKYLLEQNVPLVNQEDLLDYLNMSQTDWMNIADKVKGSNLIKV
jgi:hypothetical protein